MNDTGFGDSTSAVLLRIFIGDHDTSHGKPLFEAIVLEARAAGLAGATVLSGFMGYGANSVVHRAHVFALSQDLPAVIEIVDDEEKVRAFLPRLEAMMRGGLVTLERLTVLLYTPDPKPGRGKP